MKMTGDEAIDYLACGIVHVDRLERERLIGLWRREMLAGLIPRDDPQGAAAIEECLRRVAKRATELIARSGGTPPWPTGPLN